MIATPTTEASGPVIPRETDQLPAELARGAEIPEGLDPLADGVLMAHQAEWIADTSDLKLCEKGRRTGITFAEALDATLIAAAKPSEGGDNYFYIGDTKDKGREFIGYVAHFAKVVAKELVTIEEFLFLDVKADGSPAEAIAAFRARFASGKRVEALSSRPENIRGLQGTVGLDEAAFHKDVRANLDAINALLIWGSKIRVISSHNGVLNPFNELIGEAKAGKVPYSLHFVPFQKAIDNGLYERTCLIKGKTPTAEGKIAWEKQIRSSYGVRDAAMKQELDCIPSEQEGAVLSRVMIESCMEHDRPVVRWTAPDTFKSLPSQVRQTAALAWCQQHVMPLLALLDPDRQHVFGEDFARSGDATDIMPLEIGVDLVRRCPFIVELRNIPFEQQRDVLFYIVRGLPRLSGGALDATGNGAYLAEVTAQEFGAIIVEVHLSSQFYQVEMTAYTAAFNDRSIILPAHEDVLRDHQAIAYMNGVPKVPDNHRFKGSDGFDRHGDTAIAGCLAYFASRQDFEHFGYAAAMPPVNRFSEPAVTGMAGLNNRLFQDSPPFRMASLGRGKGIYR